MSLKIIEQHNAQTGRTTRMLDAAIGAALKGERCVVVCADYKNIRAFQERCATQLRNCIADLPLTAVKPVLGHGADEISVGRTGAITFTHATDSRLDWKRMRLTFTPHWKVFADHNAIYEHFNAALTEFHRYDVPPQFEAKLPRGVRTAGDVAREVMGKTPKKGRRRAVTAIIAAALLLVNMARAQTVSVFPTVDDSGTIVPTPAPSRVIVDTGGLPITDHALPVTLNGKPVVLAITAGNTVTLYCGKGSVVINGDNGHTEFHDCTRDDAALMMKLAMQMLFNAYVKARNGNAFPNIP